MPFGLRVGTESNIRNGFRRGYGVSYIVSRTLLLTVRISGIDRQPICRYYDLTNSLCSTAQGGPFPANWAESTGINNGLPKCEQFAVGTGAKSLAQLGTNRVVGESCCR